MVLKIVAAAGSCAERRTAGYFWVLLYYWGSAALGWCALLYFTASDVYYMISGQAMERISELVDIMKDKEG